MRSCSGRDKRHGGHAYVQRLVGCNVATGAKEKLSAFFCRQLFMYVLFWGSGEQCSPTLCCDFVCLFLSEYHELADDIVKYQHNNVCHYLCYPIVEAEK